MEHHAFSRRSFTTSRHNSSTSSHKSMRQNLDRMESTVTAIPQALGEYMECFNSFCMSGIKLSSLLETMFQDTPVLLVALRFREACELLNDKCSRATVILKGEIVPPVTKKLAPSLSKLRSRIDEHAKALYKHESHVKQLDNLNSSQNPNKQKLEQLEAKFQTSATDFAKEDAQLVEAKNEVQKIRVEVMGSCFLSFLEAQSKLLASASDLMAPLGDYKEVGEGLKDLLNPMVKEATVGWLAAAQVNQNLRSFGNMSRNDVQCMVSNHRDGLPSTISRGLNMKVDQLLKKYVTELKQTPSPHHKVIGGFHLNPKGIQLALRDCCSELEAKGAGAPHALTKAEKEGQVNTDIPRVSCRIMEEEFGCAYGEDVERNIEAKKQAIVKLIQSLPLYSVLEGEDDKVEDFAFQVLNESCTTVTNTPAKTAVQLVFGNANLIFVRPSPSSDDNNSIVISPRQVDSSVSIVVHSSWWLVEDYAVFAILGRSIEPSSSLGVIDVVYTINLKLQNFIRDGHLSELASISVTYRQDPGASLSTDVTSSSLKDKENPLHTLNRTLKSFLSVKRRSRSPQNGGKDGQGESGGGEGESQACERNRRQNGSFQCYIKEVEVEEKCGRGGEGGIGSSSSGSSPLSNSPGGERRLIADDGCQKVEKGRRMMGEDGDIEEEEEEYKLSSKHRYSRRERGSGGVRESEVVELGSSGGGGGSSSHSSLTKGLSGHSDSLGRGLKAFSHAQLRRYPSNESMSSQSTLVPKQGYEHDDSMGIDDILRTTAPGHGLTQSNIRDHVKHEARKHGHGKHYMRHPSNSQQLHEEEEEFEYEKGKNGYGTNRRRTHGGGGLIHDGRRRDERRERSGRQDRSEVKEVDEGSESPLDMHVSPANENVNIASESEVQNVIAFLSGGNSYDSGFECQHKPNDGASGDGLQQRQGDYTYLTMEYGGHMTAYNNGRYVGVASGGDGEEGVWSSPGVADQKESEKPSHARNAALRQGEGSEGSGSVARDFDEHSRAASISPRVEGEGREELRGTRSSNSGKDGIGGMVKDDQRYGQQHHNNTPHSNPSKKKGSWERRDQPHSDNGRDAQELSLVLSKGFGQLITPELGGSGGMHLLHGSPDYQLSLRLLKGMNDDSDSEISGGGSIPLVSSSSSDNQSPILPRTRSAECVNDSGQSSSQTSNHSVPFSTGPNHGSAPHLDNQFNHAPGTRLPHPKVGGGGPHFSKFEYDDCLSQGSYNGGRGSNSQDSNDPPWDWGMDQRSRAHHYEYNKHPCEYDSGLLHSRGSYDSAVTHHLERQPCTMQRTMGTRSLDDYSQAPGMGPPMFDRGGNSMALPGSLSSRVPPPHGSVCLPPRGGGPPGQYCPPLHPLPQHRPGPGPGCIPPSSQGGTGPGPMPHMPGPGSMPLYHGQNRPPPSCGPPGGRPPPFHVHPQGGPQRPHLNGAPPHSLNGSSLPPPPPGHNHPLWYDSFEPPRIHGPVPSLSGPHPPHPTGPAPPHHSNSIHDNRFRSVPFGGGRSNTPSDAPSPASMHSMSPGPSPHPTPPPTPPPNMGGGPPPHHSPMMHPGGLPCPPGTNVVIRHMPPPGHPKRVPPSLWEGPNQRDFRPLHPSHLGSRGPPIGHRPPQNMSGPPMPMYSSGYPNQIPEWERNSWHH